MKDLTLFYLESCPHCKRARQYMDELRSENPKYAEIDCKMIEEREQKALADSYDYYYVPCYYIGGEKVSEGSVTKDDVSAVLDKTLES